MTAELAADDPPPGRGAPGGRARFSEPAMRDALEPVRAELLRRAREQADAIVAGARDQAANSVARARRQADEQVAAARRAGRAQAAPLAAARRSRGRREARSVLLGAQRKALEEFRAQVRAAVGGLRAEPGYDALLARLTDSARRLAGPDAVVDEHPGGGVVARGPGRVVDCSLPRLADAAVDALGADVEQLWAPGRLPRRGEP